jgi:CHAT domain-containing protein
MRDLILAPRRAGGRRLAAAGWVGVVVALTILSARAVEPLAREAALVEGLFLPGRDADAAAHDAAEVRRLLAGHLEPAGPSTVDAAHLLGRVAAWYAVSGDTNTAERLYREANVVLTGGADRLGTARGGEFKVGGVSSALELAANMHALALLAEAAGRADEAERLLGQAIEIGDGDGMFTATRDRRRDLARLLLRRRKFPEAEALVTTIEETSAGAVGIIEDSHDPTRRWRVFDRLPFVSSRLDRALLEAARGAPAAALAAMDDGRRAMRLWLNQELRILPTRDQLAMIARDDALGLDTCLSLGMRYAAVGGAAELSAGWLANGKAAAAEAAADRLRAAQREAEENRPDAREKLDKLRTVQRRMATAMLLGGNGRRLAELEREEKDLVDSLGTRANMVRDDDANWVELDAIRARIPAGAVLCDIARFRVRNFESGDPKDDWAPARYAVWVVPPAGAGPVRIIDLGPAAAIDDCVQQWRELLDAAMGPRGLIVAEGESRAEARLAAAGRALAKLVLDPVLEAAGPQADELIVVPDGPLWLVAWAALPLDDGRYAVERYTIRHVLAARDLVPRAAAAPAGAAMKRSRPLILAAPDFNRGLPAGAAAGPTGRGVGVDARRLLHTVAALPGTEREAQLVAPLVAQAMRSSTDVATEEDATERRFLATPRPAAVILATHGFFLAGSKSPGGGVVASSLLRSAGLPPNAALDIDPLLTNPLARCGILLAGCNAASANADGADDGILTGLEIAGCDLRGTKLVVLSACDTAVGLVTDGEGVAGLRQAFQLAGAETVVATLWPIPDAETVGLMEGMFAALAKGAPATHALRAAQLATIAGRRDLLETAHPVMWAAFTVTGTGAP